MKSILLIFFFISCTGDNKQLISIEGKTMGTYYQVKAYGNKKPEILKKDIDHFLKLFNNIFSTYIPDSELSKINRTKFDKVKLSEPMAKLVEISLEIFQKSEGFFDITVGPLVNAWGFGPKGKRKKPTKEDLEQLKAKVGSQLIALQKDYLLLKRKGLYLDMSAIAKGFGVDELVKHLEYQGFTQFLVEIGGEVRTRGKKLNGEDWRLGIEGPSEKRGEKLVKVVSLNNMSMATSGSYRNYLKYGDDIFSHTIDPITAMPVKHQTISVTVIHEYCADADAWATAFMSMGAEKGIDIANKNNLMALFQVKKGSDIVMLSTTEFDKYITSTKDK